MGKRSKGDGDKKAGSGGQGRPAPARAVIRVKYRRELPGSEFDREPAFQVGLVVAQLSEGPNARGEKVAAAHEEVG